MREKPPGLHVSSVSRLEAAEGSSVPVYLCRVSAGFPSPASDYAERDIDLNDWLIRNKPATYIVRVEGDSMEGEIHPDDRSSFTARWTRVTGTSSSPASTGRCW